MLTLSYKGNVEGLRNYLLDVRFMQNKFAQEWKEKLVKDEFYCKFCGATEVDECKCNDSNYQYNGEE